MLQQLSLITVILLTSKSIAILSWRSLLPSTGNGGFRLLQEHSDHVWNTQMKMESYFCQMPLPLHNNLNDLNRPSAIAGEPKNDGVMLDNRALNINGKQRW
jgi:hypothetical protein